MGNKVSGANDAAWLRDELGDVLLATVGQSDWVRMAEQGRSPAFAALELPVQRALDSVLAELDAQPRDWRAYHRDTVHFHLLNARAWGNRSTGGDLTVQVDPDFVPGAPCDAVPRSGS